MNREQIQARAEELEAMKMESTRQRAEKLAEVEIKKSELNDLQSQADRLNWVNRAEARELEELKVALKWIGE